MFGAIGSVSPSRSISPNPMALQMTPNESSMHQQQQQQQQQNPFVFPTNGYGLNGMYQSFGSPRNMFDGGNNQQYNQFNGTAANGGSSNDPLFTATNGKCSSFMDQQTSFCKIPSQQQQQNSQSSLQVSPQQGVNAGIVNANGGPNVNASSSSSSSSNNSSNQQQSQQADNKLLDGMNAFYNNNSNSNPSSYQHLLVAN